MQAKIEMTFVISTSHWYHYNPLASIIRWCARTIICQGGDSESSSGINQTPFFLSLSFSLSAFYILSLISYIKKNTFPYLHSTFHILSLISIKHLFLICILHSIFDLWSQWNTFPYLLVISDDPGERPTFGCPTSQHTNWEVPEHCRRCWFELNTYYLWYWQILSFVRYQ